MNCTADFECQICTDTFNYNYIIICDSCNQIHCKKCNDKMPSRNICPFCRGFIKNIDNNTCPPNRLLNVNPSNTNSINTHLLNTNPLNANPLNPNRYDNSIDMSSYQLNTEINRTPISDKFFDEYKWNFLAENVTDIMFTIFVFVMYILYG